MFDLVFSLAAPLLLVTFIAGIRWWFLFQSRRALRRTQFYLSDMLIGTLLLGTTASVLRCVCGPDLHFILADAACAEFGGVIAGKLWSMASQRHGESRDICICAGALAGTVVALGCGFGILVYELSGHHGSGMFIGV